MKKNQSCFAGLSLLLLGLLLCSGCGEAKPKLHVYIWSDYIKDDLVKQFQKEYNCKVVIDTFDSNESMYAKLKAGATGYDVLFPSSYMVKIMNDQAMLQNLDHTLLPDVKANLDPKYLALAFDKEMTHSVPYMVTVTCLGYLGSRVEDFEPSWSQLDRADLKGRMTMLNDIRETIGAALKYLGYSLNTTNDAELQEAKAVAIAWKKNIAKYENEQYKNGLASGEFLLVHGYGGDLMQVQEENDDIVLAVPREGSVISFDDMVIPADSQNVELAHHFINFLHRPQVAAENTEFVYYLCPNTGSYELLSDEIREDEILFPADDVIANLEMIDDLGDENVKYNILWDEIKAAE